MRKKLVIISVLAMSVILAMLASIVLARTYQPVVEEKVSFTATSATYPGTVATSSSAPENGYDWSSPNNVKAADTSYASITHASFDAGVISYRMRCSNFGFTIPAGSTINGILVEINRYNDVGETGKDYRVQLVDDSATLVGTNKAINAAWQTSVTKASYGGSSDTWSASPTVTMVNDTNFGVMFSAVAIDNNCDIYVDYIRITITYTPPTFVPKITIF